MPLTVPSTDAGRAALDLVLAEPQTVLLATDLDGTLAPIVADPDQAYAHPDAAPTLARLDRLLGGVAVITGRPVATALRLGGVGAIGGWRRLQVLGQYGLERWDGVTGETRVPESDPGIAAVREELPRLLAQLDATDAHIEDKGLAVGVHTRRTADPAGLLRQLSEPLRALAQQHGLQLEEGRAVLELRPRGMDKGAALSSLLDARAAECVVFVGDDLGDLPAFELVGDLRATGRHGLLICSASAEQTALVELADLVLDGPDDVVRWLGELADVLDS